jgi:hypothetical protein
MGDTFGGKEESEKRAQSASNAGKRPASHTVAALIEKLVNIRDMNRRNPSTAAAKEPGELLHDHQVTLNRGLRYAS